jgi:excinuclease ABC subunit C
MVGEVTEILKGRTSRLAASLRKSMDDSAADMRFEDAARFRDRLRELSVYNDRQKVVDLKSDECDYAAVAVREDHGCAVVFKIREGKITGRPHFPLSGALDRPETEILGEFIDTYYLESTDVPPEVCVAAELPDREVVEEWLRQKRGGPVKIVRPRSGEKARLLEMCRKNAGMLLDMMMLQRAQQKRVPAALGILAKELRLPAEPHWIECFDVSHFQGSDTVGSVVVYNDGRPKKSEYRKFILSTAGPDDFASMRELVNRRYSRRLAEQEPLPDLIVIDGGKGQLSAAIESLDGLGLAGGPRAVREPVPVVGLAKKLEEIYLSTLSGLTPLSALTPVTAPGAVVTLPKTSPGLKLLQQLRNEAHRFGVTFHRNRRSGRILTTELDLVKGVGRKRATALLEAFGSVQGVRFATAGQLTEIVGEAVAARIQEYFSNMGPENGTFQETPTVG